MYTCTVTPIIKDIGYYFILRILTEQNEWWSIEKKGKYVLLLLIIIIMF